MLDELQYYAQDKNRHIEEVQDLVTKMINQHKESLEKPSGEMITNCFEEYGHTIDRMEQKDIKQLKMRVGELKGMQNNMKRDAEEAERSKATRLRNREQFLLENKGATGDRRGGDRLRQQCEARQQQVQDKSDELLNVYSQEERNRHAEEVKGGQDKLYEKNYADVFSNYDIANEAL